MVPSLTKPKGKIYKTKFLGHYITPVASIFSDSTDSFYSFSRSLSLSLYIYIYIYVYFIFYPTQLYMTLCNVSTVQTTVICRSSANTGHKNVLLYLFTDLYHENNFLFQNVLKWSLMCAYLWWNLFINVFFLSKGGASIKLTVADQMVFCFV